jgi:hypothetical protein
MTKSRPNQTGRRTMDTSMTGFLIGLALTLTMLLAIADMES